MCCFDGDCFDCRERRQSDEALAYLRAKLSGHRVGEGDVTFTRIDGRTVTIKNVRVDSIGPGADNFGVVAVEFFGNDDVVHVPFVESWTINYNV